VGGHDQTLTAGQARPAGAQALPVAGGARLELLGFDLAAAFHESPLGIVIIDGDGRWQEVNPAWCAILGRPRADLLGRHFNDFTHLDDLAVGLEMFATLDGGARSVQAEKRYMGADGGVFERGRVDHGGARRTGPQRPLTNSSRRPVGTTSLGEDITEKMLAQRALARRATHDPLTASRTGRSTVSSVSTTASAMPPATRCCARSRAGCAASAAPTAIEFVIVITGGPGESAPRLRSTRRQVADRAMYRHKNAWPGRGR
jgi:PAS domain S-box-containing protein